MEEKFFIIELAKALKEKKDVVFIFIGPDGTSIKCAVENGNILYIEGLYGSGKSEIERIIKWKKGKIIEKPLKDEDKNKKGEFIDPNPIISILEKFEDKRDLFSEFIIEYLKLLKTFINEFEMSSMNFLELLNSNKSKNIYYIQNKGFLFLKDNEVEGFLNTIGKFMKNFYTNEIVIFSKLVIENWQYDLLKLPFEKQPEIEGQISSNLLIKFLSEINGLFFICEDNKKIIVMKDKENKKIYKTSSEIAILENLEIKLSPFVLIWQ